MRGCECWGRTSRILSRVVKRGRGWGNWGLRWKGMFEGEGCGRAVRRGLAVWKRKGGMRGAGRFCLFRL